MLSAGGWLLYHTQNKRMLRRVRGWRPEWLRSAAEVDKLMGGLFGPVMLRVGAAEVLRGFF